MSGDYAEGREVIKQLCSNMMRKSANRDRPPFIEFNVTKARIHGSVNMSDSSRTNENLLDSVGTSQIGNLEKQSLPGRAAWVHR
jgi:hypothetical protein